MNTIRYKLSKDARFIYIDKIKTEIPYCSNPILIDILEPMECEGICASIPVKLFLPDGNIMKGTVSGHLIEIHNRDFLFDGRFNSTQDK